VRTRVASILSCNLDSLSFTYLGLLIKLISLTRGDRQPLIERIEKRLTIWKCNALSRGGRLILVNSVLSSMLLYYISFYFLPKWVIHAIDRIRHAFFWKVTRSIYEGFCLINWQLVCSHKNQGGLSVWNVQAFNLAVLPKWWWRFFNDTNASWVSFVMHNYYRRRRAHDLHICLTEHVSPFWRGVLKASWLLLPVFILLLEMDAQQDFGLIIGWEMIHLLHYFPTYLCLQGTIHNGNISNLCPWWKYDFAPHFRRWPNQFMGANLYNDLNSLLTLLRPLHLSTLPDVWQWKLKQEGILTVNSLYPKLTGYREENNYFR